MGVENILVAAGYIVKYLPTLFGFIRAAEQTKETGVVKKATVTGGFKTLIHAISTEATGGAKETWDALEQPLSETIDAVVDELFNHQDSITFDDDDEHSS